MDDLTHDPKDAHDTTLGSAGVASPGASSTMLGKLQLPLRLSGAALLLAGAGIHLDLYLTGYRHIPTIGSLFLLQVIVAILLGLAIAATRSVLLALAGAGFALSTFGGWVLSLWVGLFGFNEVRTTAGVVAAVIDVGGFVVLGLCAATAPLAASTTVSSAGGMASARSERMALAGRFGRISVAPAGALATLALVLASALASSPGGAAAASASSSSGGSSTSAAASSGTAKIAVSIDNFAFKPATFKVRPGERIVVTNRDSVTHTFSAEPGSGKVGHFNSGNIAPGKTVTVIAPTAKGTYSFYCAIHPFMTGSVTVS